MMIKGVGKYNSAAARWAGVGPYYAMFPIKFADSVVRKYTEEGDTIIDPFSGRGTSLFSAASASRHALGVEINPVGWIYAATKLGPAQRSRVEDRVEEIAKLSSRFSQSVSTLPKFFRYCFATEVAAFLLAARKHLDWRNSVVDRTTMAIVLIDLHGKRAISLSNQMRQTKAMSPEYAVQWWRERNLRPPTRDVTSFLHKKIAWRYAKGTPGTSESRVYLADCTHDLTGLRQVKERIAPNGAKLLFTSPPYLGITNYHYDQWLRLWMLGGAPVPATLGSKHRGKFTNPDQYAALLRNAFMRASTLLAKDATIYVRTDRRRVTSKITRQVLTEVFPRHRLSRTSRPLEGPTQTRLFGNGAPKAGEVDFVLVSADLHL